MEPLTLNTPPRPTVFVVPDAPKKLPPNADSKIKSSRARRVLVIE